MCRDEDIAELISLDTIAFDSYFPFARFLIPPSTDNPRIELKISVQVPLLDSALDICQNIRTAGIELLPVRVRIEWKCLMLLAVVLKVTYAY